MVDSESDSAQVRAKKHHMRKMLSKQKDFFGISFDEVQKYFAYGKESDTMLLNPAAFSRLLKYKQELMKQLPAIERNKILEQMAVLAKDKKSLLMMLASMSCEWMRNVKGKDKINSAIQAKGTSDTSQEELKKTIELGIHYCLDTKIEPTKNVSAVLPL